MGSRRSFTINDYSGEAIRILNKDYEKCSIRGFEKYIYDSYIFPALEFPDEVFFFKNTYVNKYLKFYQDFFIVVEVSLLEFDKRHGMGNKVNKWEVVQESVEFPYAKRSLRLQDITCEGDLVYKYVPSFH